MKKRNDMVKRVAKYRARGLSFREIMHLLKITDVKSVYRWYQYGLKSYAQKGR